MNSGSVVALQELFTLPPLTLLLKGTHCTVYFEPSGVRVKDDIENLVHPFDVDVQKQEHMRNLLEKIFGTGDFRDVEVNGREFAFTRLPEVINNGLKGAEYIVTARHRLHKDESAIFKASLITII